MNIIFFAIVALVIFWKLKSQLGKIDEDQKKQIIEKINQAKFSGYGAAAAAQSTASVRDNEPKVVGNQSSNSKEEEELLINLSADQKRSVIFALTNANTSARPFIDGAKQAFEMVIKAFAAEDLATLKMLLAEKIYLQFEQAIKQRQAEKKKLVTNIVALMNPKILEGSVVANRAFIKVNFVSKQINYITNEMGEVIEGRKDVVSGNDDNWMLSKDLNSPDPNWIVTTTGL